MADDIDIEEHDVLENPLIKRIFPDLTILKKEIIDYNNYEHEESSQNSNFDESRSTTNTETDVIKQIQKAYSNDLINNTFKNKIILGSKNISSTNEVQMKQNLNGGIKKAKVCLPNITQMLYNNNKFCKVCLILFPSKESFNRHTMLAHKNTQKNCIVNQNKESKKIKAFYKCLKCNITFASLGNLNRHERNFHSHIKKNKIKDDDRHLHTEVDMMVKINDANSKSLVEGHLKDCFHCDTTFTTQQLLIDHLYEVLNAKKIQIASKQKYPQDNEQIDKTNDQPKEIITKDVQEIKKIEPGNQNIKNNSIEDTNTDEIYACPVCSYCFNIWEFYEAHMKKKHSVNKVKQINKVAYKPNCKFCDLQYSTYKSYNTHLHKRHKNKILQNVTMQRRNNVKKINTKESRKVIVQRNQQIKQKILLGSNKIKFANTLKHKGNYKNKLNCIKNDVQVMALKTMLFKCTQCNIHFLTTESAKRHINHNLLENSKCIYCEKYFKENDLNLHLEQHKYSNYFSVTNISRKKNVTKIKRKNTAQRTLYKCPFCAVHFSKENIFDHYSICETESSKSTYCKICDILIAENIKISHGNEHDLNELKPSDFKVVEFKKIKNKHIRRKQDASLKMCEEMYLFNLSYCDVCTCNVARAHYKSTIHFQSRCSHFIKYVCKYCGLVFSNKSINTHRKLHKKFCNLSLKDFTFYDLKSGNKILPPIPAFPKCNSCEKHFITKYEVKVHVCHRNNHLTCPTCKIKLSHSAYKLHIPFHNLTLNNEIEKPLVSEDVSLDVNIAALSDEFQSQEELLTTFTCKNCVVSFNLYDEAIDHCHSHTDLDTINPDTVECGICNNIPYDAACYEKHQRLHNEFPGGTFKYIKFDVFNFASPNDKWWKHMFGSMPLNVVDDIVKNAIYKYETRLKMRILQNESPDMTVYKCGKCQCFIDCHIILKHSKTCNEVQKYICNICHLPVTSSAKNEHEKCDIILKSYRIIEFNGKQDEDVNYKIANRRKCYILYECRLCHSVVDKKYENHLCVAGTSKECSICGLLLNELDYDKHISKHKRLNSFNENFMKVILLGTKPNDNNRFQRRDILSRFSGIVCDYTFYKCLNCDVCVRDKRNTSQHYCLIDAAKSKCPKCDLIFDEGKLKGHLKLHDTDPDFVKETILVQVFGNKLIKKIETYENTEEKDTGSCVRVKNGFGVNNQSNKKINTVEIYKCVCGLHYLTEETIKVHTKKCNGKIKTKQSKQTCSKCDLTFSPDVLFKHLIEHHGNKEILFQYEIINFNYKPL